MSDKKDKPRTIKEEALESGVLSAEQNEETLELFEEEFGKDKKEELESEDSPQLVKEVDLEENETAIEITESKQNIDFDFLTKNILYTNYLDNYDMLDLDLGLDGENYKAFKKTLWYYHHSLQQPTVLNIINRKTRVDNRKHLLTFTAPSGGKSTTKNQVRKIVDEEDYIEVSGLSHPEQLVGKVKYKGKGDNKISVPSLGVLSYKAVVSDEAQDMLNEKNEIYAKAQRIKRIAMDNFGENTISKKLVDDDKEDVLKYDPECRVCDFAHPEKLESPFFVTGSFRRYDISNLSHEDVIDIDKITEFILDDKKISNEDYVLALKKQYKDERVNVKFNQGSLDIVGHFHKSLLYFLLNHKNQNAFRYALLTRYSLRNSFCKNVLILALSKNEETPTTETVINACTDTLLFVLKSIESINDLGDMGLSSDLWGGACEEDAQVLEYLFRKKAISQEDSSVSIKKFWTILGHIYGCRITQSRAHFYRLKKDGFVDSKRATGDDKSKVWLKFIPKEIRIESKEENPIKFWEKHLVTVGHKKVLSAVTQECFTDDKLMKKLASVGSVGVMGCVLINERICVKPLSKNKNNIYIGKGHPITPTVPTVTPIQTSTATIKDVKPTVKTPKNRPTVTPTSKSNRDLQFFEAPECKDIIPTCKKEDVLKWIKENPNGFDNFKELDNKFGIASLKYRNELKQEGLI